MESQKQFSMAKNTRQKGFKYFILKQKFYFDTGLGVSGYFKYLIVGFGFTIKDTMLTIIAGLFSAIVMYLVGFLWCKYNLSTISNDIANSYNPFVTDTLKLLSESKKFK